MSFCLFFFFNDTATTEIYTLSLHDALPISSYGGVVAPPILYGRALFPELRALEAESCGKSVVRNHRAEAVELQWPPETLTDLDSPEDVERIRARLEAA